MARITALCFLLVALAFGAPAAFGADGDGDGDGDEGPASAGDSSDDGVDGPGTAPGAETTGGDAAAAAPGDAAAPVIQLDPLTQRMHELVRRYYEAVGDPPSDAELTSGLQSIQAMLLDGVALSRVQAAVASAIELHTPGRRVPFEIAVPLRVRPDESAATSTPPASRPPRGGPAPAAATPVDPAVEARRAERRRVAQERLNRQKLYRQWRDRTERKRTFLSVGIPLWATGYALGFGAAGVQVSTGAVPHYSAWITAVPVVGNLILGIWLEGQAPWHFVFMAVEWTGIALTAVGVFSKVDWPYDRDPTALHLGRRRDGRAALHLKVRPAGAGGMLIGRF